MKRVATLSVLFGLMATINASEIKAPTRFLGNLTADELEKLAWLSLCHFGNKALTELLQGEQDEAFLVRLNDMRKIFLANSQLVWVENACKGLVPVRRAQLGPGGQEHTKKEIGLQVLLYLAQLVNEKRARN